MHLRLSIDDAVRWVRYVAADRRKRAEQKEQQIPPTPGNACDTDFHQGEVADHQGLCDEGYDDEIYEDEAADQSLYDEGYDDENSDDEDTDKGDHASESWNPTREMEQAMELEEVIEEFEEMDAELMEEVVFRTSLDLTELDDVTDPMEFIEELKAFEKLKDELVRGTKQRKIENARRVDDEHFAKLYQSSNHTPSTSDAGAKDEKDCEAFLLIVIL
ncbi:hypothetical protein MPER_13088 [Moniliophthora perniciosa FA553]|nr:hypothetical protein MPER_13088 [Moniliophthora perniciosa FA553]